MLGWLLSAGLCLTVVFGVQPLMDTEHHPYNVVESSFYMGFYRLAWSAGLFWVVLACITGHGGTPENVITAIHSSQAMA